MASKTISETILQHAPMSVNELTRLQSVEPISLWQELGLAWFAVSIVLVIGTAIFFMLWLRSKDAKLTFGLTGIPGYLEMHYVKLCRQEGRNAKTVLILRTVLWINALLAAIVVVPLAIMA